MKKFLTMIVTAILVMAMVTVAFADKDIFKDKVSPEEIPATLAMVLEMPDGSIEIVDLTKMDELEKIDVVADNKVSDTKQISSAGDFGLPPIYIWNPGWFMYLGTSWYGWYGTYGFANAMTFSGGFWHCFRFENVNNTWQWVYYGTL